MNHLHIGRALAALAVAGCAASNAALPDLEGVVALGAGPSVVCAALGTGGAACWGEERIGAWAPILRRTTSGRAAGPVADLEGAFGPIAVGVSHACAAALDGRLWCWGINDRGQLGVGSPNWSPVAPTPVPLPAGVSDVATGSEHTCAVAGGAAYCWGGNTSGEVGDGTTTQRDVPVPVVGLTDGVHRIAAGGASGPGFSCATRAGAAWCWGANGWGQLGDGSTTGRPSPVQVAGLGTGTTEIAAGTRHACAVRSGAVWCWGHNGSGQLGDGTWADRTFPVAAVNAASRITAVAAGGMHTCALRDDGAVLCWGGNTEGQLGDGTYDSRTVAAPVVGLAAPAVAIATGESFTCALLATGRVQCFGTTLGLGFLSPRQKAVDFVAPAGAFRLSGGWRHTCGVGPSGDAFCVGEGEDGVLGNGSLRVAAWPTPVTRLSAGVVDVAAGFTHSCARTTTGAALCWGRGSYGQLGDATGIDSPVPVAVTGLDSGVTDVAAGQGFTCAVAGGGARCWGSNASGQLGTGTYDSSNVPVGVWGMGQGVARIRAGDGHACALRSDSGLKCWGENWDGRLGDGTTVRRTTPVDVLGLSHGVRDVALGAEHTCAIDASGALWCWGNNQYGVLGDGTQVARPVPVRVAGLPPATAAVAAGRFHTCALLQGGEVRCWGYNGDGQVGAGAETWLPVLLPVAVPLGEPALGLTAGAAHTCALLAGGRAKCWGDANDARLGNGDVRRSPLPRTVKAGVFDSTIALAALPSPSVHGQYVTITARVDTLETVAGGDIWFADGAVPLVCAGEGPRLSLRNGVGTCNVPLFTGVHEIRATYPGYGDALPSSAVLLHAVGPVAGQHCAGFDDVDAADPLCTAVEWIRNRAITLGCAPFAYCPDDAVKRNTMAAFLDRLGGAIGPTVQTWSMTNGSLWPGVGFCTQAVVPVQKHPGRLVADAVVSGVASGAATLRFELMVDGDAFGLAVAVTADATRATVVRLAGGLEVEPNRPAPAFVGFRYTADPQVTLSDVRCIIRTQLFDRTGTYSPFDVPQGARP